MPSFSRESLELLRSRIDLVEVLSPYIKLQRTGASYKALCPFHEEKSPSFVIQRGDSHYHCFGCGAHGDAIQFLMTHLKMSFLEAVETLAEKFHVHLEESRGEKEPKGPSKTAVKHALEIACRFYQFALLHTMEGHIALDYLYNRGIDLDFIKTFQLGLAPKLPQVFLKMMREHKISDDILEGAGLISNNKWEFFADRITIPIRDAVGAVIGFSARKFKTDTFGGKYINTPETVLFKKSKVLFGLSYSRKRIAKDRKALIVEGQIDALRLIYAGFNWTVAGQGTAFGEDHAKELIHLGVHQVYLALDGDVAGKEATVKVGHIFQKEGIEVLVVPLPEKCDPDLVLQEKGPEEWQKMLDASVDYLEFLVNHLSSSINIQSPAGKNELVQSIAKRIRDWDHPLMVHESLRKLARLTQTPESLLNPHETNSPQIHIKRQASVTFTEVNPDRILEADLLRWLILMGPSLPQLIQIAEWNLTPDHFRYSSGRGLYEKYIAAVKDGKPCDLLSLAIDIHKPAWVRSIHKLRAATMTMRIAVCDVVNLPDNASLLELRIYSGKCSEEEVLDLARKFDLIKKERPQAVVKKDEGT